MEHFQISFTESQTKQSKTLKYRYPWDYVTNQTRSSEKFNTKNTGIFQEIYIRNKNQYGNSIKSYLEIVFPS